jgi:hypothetical protein
MLDGLRPACSQAAVTAATRLRKSSSGAKPTLNSSA